MFIALCTGDMDGYFGTPTTYGPFETEAAALEWLDKGHWIKPNNCSDVCREGFAWDFHRVSEIKEPAYYIKATMNIDSFHSVPRDTGNVDRFIFIDKEE